MRDVKELHFASKCIIIDGQNRILILKRTDYSGNGTGEWDFPGGSVNENEDINDSIKREVQEELKIAITEAKVFKITSGKGIPSGQFIFVLFASKNYDLKEGIKLSKEHSEYKWISLADMDTYKFYLRDSIINDIKHYLKELR